MPDDVWPVSARHPGPGSLYSWNGIGFEFKGFTRKDATEHCFATRWFMIIGLPAVPLGRYYVRDDGIALGQTGVNRSATRYRIGGTGRLRAAEVPRTYAFGWLTPIIAIVPLIALLYRADDMPLWLPITAVCVWPTLAIVLAVTGVGYYRKHWAPLRTVNWRVSG
jgi:hypothetical protein